MTTEKDLKVLRDRITSYQREETRAEIARDQAVKEMQSALDSLKKEFNVDSVEEAEKYLLKLRKRIDKDTKAIDSLLTDLGA